MTCSIHCGEVDDSDTIELPMGLVCSNCYVWIEDLMEQDEDESEYLIVEFEEEDEEL